MLPETSAWRGEERVSVAASPDYRAEMLVTQELSGVACGKERPAGLKL
jgi:hypothetical protein